MPRREDKEPIRRTRGHHVEGEGSTSNGSHFGDKTCPAYPYPFPPSFLPSITLTRSAGVRGTSHQPPWALAPCWLYSNSLFPEAYVTHGCPGRTPSSAHSHRYNYRRTSFPLQIERVPDPLFAPLGVEVQVHHGWIGKDSPQSCTKRSTVQAGGVSGPFGQREKKREQEDRRGWRWDGARPAREHAEHVPDWKMHSTHKIRQEVAKDSGPYHWKSPEEPAAATCGARG